MVKCLLLCLKIYLSSPKVFAKKIRYIGVGKVKTHTIK
jgi:hypothetical protein